ncbi:MAG: outer membrane protein assembly factor BamD [Proteobacteria bacterium]|nr:outer membrane protein assembly factor BamD [Pseudomonadota bacterium]
MFPLHKSLTPLLLLAALNVSGCFLWTTNKEGDAMAASIDALQQQLATLEQRQSKVEDDLTAMLQKARSEMDELNDTLTKATRILARNSADFGAEMEGIKDQMMASQGTFAELQHAIEVLQKEMSESTQRVTDFALAAGLDLPIDESRVPQAEIDHLKAIRDALSAGRYGECRSLIKVFQKRYPASKNADEVQLLMARAYIAQKRHANALGALRAFVDNHARSPLMPEVLYEMANSFFQLGNCTDARVLIDTIQSRHASSPFAPKGQILLGTINNSQNRCMN